MFCTRLRKDLLLVARRVTLLITGRNEVVAKVMFLLMSVILSTGGALPQCMLGYCHPHKKEAPPRPRRTPQGGTPPPRRTPPPCQGDPPEKVAPPCQGDPPRRRPPRRHPLPRRPPPKKEAPPCQGDPPCQEGGPPPGPHPRGKLRGIRSRPTPKGEIEGDQIQGPHPRGKLRGIRSKPPPHIRSMSGQYASYWNAFLFKAGYPLKFGEFLGRNTRKN